MNKGYRKVLINGNVVPDKDAHWLTTSLDTVRILVFAVTERTGKNLSHQGTTPISQDSNSLSAGRYFDGAILTVYSGSRSSNLWGCG